MGELLGLSTPMENMVLQARGGLSHGHLLDTSFPLFHDIALQPRACAL